MTEPGPGLAPASVLRRSPNVVVRTRSDDGFDLVMGATSVECGRHTLAVLDVFGRPRSLQEALDRLAERVTGAQGWIDITAEVAHLHRVGALVAGDSGGDGGGGASGLAPERYAAPGVHIRMLDDRTRTEAFLRAVAATVKEGDVVIDLGTGTGVLAVAAAKAGARRVYAIEASTIGRWAQSVFDANGVADRVELVPGWSTDVALPEQADVLVSEMVGHEALAERVLEVTIDARTRLLAPGARLVPRRLRVFGLPVAIPPAELDDDVFTEDNVSRWRSWYGISFDPLLQCRRVEPAAFTVRAERVQSWPALSEPVLLADVDLQQVASPQVSAETSGTASRAGQVDAVLVAFEIDLAPGITVSTNPAHVDAGTHWRAPVWPLPEPLHLRQGDRFVLAYSRRVPGTVDGVTFRPAVMT